MANVTLSDLQDALSDVSYPIPKSDLVAHAGLLGTGEDVLKALRSLPPVDYESSEEVIRSVTVDVEPGSGA